MPNNTNIICPHCHTSIDVNEAIYHQLENQIKKENSIDEQKIRESIKKQMLEEQNDSILLLQKELDEKSAQIQELNAAKIEVTKLKRQNKEIESSVRAQAELQLSEQLTLERVKVKKASDEENELKIKQKEEQLQQLTRQLKDAQRKAEQGSMQLQGEAQELAIEEYLKSSFPFDEIAEIKKGAKGADCIQVVNTRDRLACGSIYYESKRTKDFSNTWIEKFKEDMRAKNADVGVLVTEVLPKSLERMGIIDGIWICTFQEFKGLSLLLRDNVLKIDAIKQTQENKSDKMSLLYVYLTSNEFYGQIEAIVESFTQMERDLAKEKRSMTSLWKQREKQIEKVFTNTINMYGSLKGVAGSSIPTIESLELVDGEE